MTMDGIRHSVDKWDLLIAHPPCTYLSNAGEVSAKLMEVVGNIYDNPELLEA